MVLGENGERGVADSSDSLAPSSDKSDYKSCFNCSTQIASSSSPSSSSLSTSEIPSLHHSTKEKSHAWNEAPPRPETQQEDWDNWLRHYQTGKLKEKDYDELQCPPSSSSLSDLMVRDSNGHLISSRDFFLQSGYVASPPAIAKHRRRRDVALLRHRLDKSFGDPLLDTHCQQAKLLFQADFSAISLAQIDPGIVQVMGASGGGLEALVNVPLPRSSSLCSHALLLGEKSAMLCDRSKDWRFSKFPFGPAADFPRQSELGFNFYASAPLMLSAPGDFGQEDIRVQVGRFCVLAIDGRDDFGEDELAQLEVISKMASDVLEKRWESRRGTKLLKMQSSTGHLTSDFHQRLLTSNSSQSMGYDDEEKLDSDIQALLQRSCEQLVEHLEAAGTVCIGLSCRSNEEVKFDAHQDKSKKSNQSGFETIIEGNGTILDTRNNVVNRLHISTVESKSSNTLSAKIRLFARAGESSHIPTLFTSSQESQIGSWMFDHANVNKVSEGRPIEYRGPSLRKEYIERYPDDTLSEEGEDADRLLAVLPDDVGTFVVMPVVTHESEPSYAFIVYWPKEYLFEDWDSNFLKSTASIVQSACIRRKTLLSERAELKVMRSVRHEMRTPLHGIIGMSTLLQQSLVAGNRDSATKSIDLSESLWLSKSIQRAGEDLRKLLDNLLECSEGNAPTSPIKGREDVSIVHLIETSCEEELLASADRALIDYISHEDEKEHVTPSPLVLIHADKEVEQAMFKSNKAERVHKMVGQFISNAIRFSKSDSNSKGEKSIVEIAVRLLSDADTTIEVTIQDNGIGMSQSFLRHFAQPFQKASTFHQGAGLGAVLARFILNQLRGSMKVSSTEGKGTCVTIAFQPDRVEVVSNDTPDLSSPSSCGILCHFDPVIDASILKLLNDHFASRNFNFVDEKSGRIDGCKFFLYDSNSLESREKLKLLCGEVSSSKKLVIFSTSSKLDIDKSIGLSPWIYCCLNPFGPTAFKALDCFLDGSNSGDTVEEVLNRAHRRSSSSDYTEHMMMSPSRRSSAPSSPTTPIRALKSLRMVPETTIATDVVSTSPIEAKPRSRRGSRKEAEATEWKSSDFSILIVEDNPINMRMLEACAKKTKCYYKMAFDGQEAVEKYKEMQLKGGPSVVLLDISLPIMDGFEACKAMIAHTLNEKGNEEKFRPRIVAITALSSPQDIENGLNLGMSEWRVKPANLPKLTADLLRWQKEWQNHSTNDV